MRFFVFHRRNKSLLNNMSPLTLFSRKSREPSSQNEKAQVASRYVMNNDGVTIY